LIFQKGFCQVKKKTKNLLVFPEYHMLGEKARRWTHES